jgi:hypothetical protein
MKKLTFETLGSLNHGAVGALVNAALIDCYKDCYYRPALSNARTVTITIEIEPHYNDKLRVMDSVELTAKVATKIPASKTDTERLRTEVIANADGEITKVDVMFALPDQDPLLPESTTNTEGKGN